MDMWRDTIGIYRVYKVYIKRNDNDKFVIRVFTRVQKNSKEFHQGIKGIKGYS
tara:strand:- start:7 stop:165 length:159 start_codon:yes stop_codon:yes gene_type:complete